MVLNKPKLLKCWDSFLSHCMLFYMCSELDYKISQARQGGCGIEISSETQFIYMAIISFHGRMYSKPKRTKGVVVVPLQANHQIQYNQCYMKPSAAEFASTSVTNVTLEWSDERHYFYYYQIRALTLYSQSRHVGKVDLHQE